MRQHLLLGASLSVSDSPGSPLPSGCSELSSPCSMRSFSSTVSLRKGACWYAAAAPRQTKSAPRPSMDACLSHMLTLMRIVRTCKQRWQNDGCGVPRQQDTVASLPATAWRTHLADIADHSERSRRHSSAAEESKVRHRDTCSTRDAECDDRLERPSHVCERLRLGRER